MPQPSPEPPVARRLRLVRRRIAAATLATFVAAWLAVAALGKGGSTSTAATSRVADDGHLEPERRRHELRAGQRRVAGRRLRAAAGRRRTQAATARADGDDSGPSQSSGPGRPRHHLAVMSEHARTVEVFGGRVALLGAGREAPLALAVAEALLRRMHAALTRFDPRSELCRLNDDSRPTVPASALVRRLAAAVPYAGALSGGLVDATVEPTFAPERTAPTGDPRPATPDPQRRWAQVSVDAEAVSRPPGVALDSGGLGKGLAADLVADRLRGLPSFAIECLGDVRAGGAERALRIASPWSDEILAELPLTDGAAATSGVTRRGWHLIDPSTGRPARTGIVQATALAPTALEAEVRAKAALLAGPAAARDHLPHGGLLVLDDGEVVSV